MRFSQPEKGVAELRKAIAVEPNYADAYPSLAYSLGLVGRSEEGYQAYLDGQSSVDNPYEFDTSKHLAWENGWFEARDEQIDHPCGPRRQAPDKP